MAASIRLHQVRAHISRDQAPAQLPETLALLLTTEAREAFRRLSVADQQHQVAVATTIADYSPDDDDLILAGLLHDIGKGAGPRQVRLHDRVAKVVLAALAPSLLNRLRHCDAPWPGSTGVWILSRHAQNGAKLARAWGYSNRVVRLIEHHEDGDPEDVDLALLISIDSQSPAEASG